MTQMGKGHDLEDARLEAFLAPLAGVAPATKRPREPLRVRRLALIAVALAVLVAGVAVAATRLSGPLHHDTITPIHSPLTCSGIIGRSAEHAESYLSSRGYRVFWRSQTYNSKPLSQPHGSTPGSVSGYSQPLRTPPANAVVWNAIRIGRRGVFVFTQARNDPNAPRIVAPKCRRNK